MQTRPILAAIFVILCACFCATAQVTLRAPLTKALAFSIGGVNRFDRRPPEGVKRNDFSLLSGVALEF